MTVASGNAQPDRPRLPPRHRRAVGIGAGARRARRQPAVGLSVRVRQGGFYGWPYAYIGKHPQPGFASLAPDKVEATITPICCSRRIPRCSTSSSTRAISSGPNTRAASSSR
jgi:hypothetical protein